MDYKVFRKSVKGKSGKTVRRWYYHWTDSAGIQHQKICKGCRNRSEADDFVRTIPGLPKPAATPPGEATVAQIAEYMYIPGSAHVSRRIQLGKSAELETMVECRRYAKVIIDLWGNMRLQDLGVDHVMPYLFNAQKSGKWKNRFLDVLGELYSEAAWYKCRIVKPAFSRFAAGTKKADIFSTAELDRLFQPANFPDEVFYLFFLLSLSGGLRLGEARGVRARQFIFDRKVFIIDGFCKTDGSRTNYNKKGSPENPKFRVVYLPDITLDKMDVWIKKNELQGDDFCFTLNGRPIRKETAEKAFYSALQSAGLVPRPEPAKRNKWGEGRKKQCRIKLNPPDGRKLVPHSLRYTYVSRMRRELTAPELQPMTGHTDEGMVDYYNRKTLDLALAALPERGKAAADSLFL